MKTSNVEEEKSVVWGLVPCLLPKATLLSCSGEKPHQFSVILLPEAHSEDWNHWEGTLLSLPMACYQLFWNSFTFRLENHTHENHRHRFLSLPCIPAESISQGNFYFLTICIFNKLPPGDCDVLPSSRMNAKFPFDLQYWAHNTRGLVVMVSGHHVA